MNHDRPWKPRWFDAVSIAVVIIVLALAVAAKLEAAVIPVKPGDDLQAAHDQAEPHDALSLEPGVYEKAFARIEKPLTIICRQDFRCVLDGLNDTSKAFLVFSDDVTFMGLTIQNYLNDGIALRGGNHRPYENRGEGIRRIRISGNIFQRIGDKWGCDEKRHNCKGYGGVTGQNYRNSEITGNIFIDLIDVDQPGGNHAIYLSNFAHSNLVAGNYMRNISGSYIKTRDDSSHNDITRNTFVGAATAIYDGPADACYKPPDGGKCVEEKPSSNVRVWDNVFDDVDDRWRCKDEAYGSISASHCKRVIVDGGQIGQLTTPDKPKPAEGFMCRSGKKAEDVKNWDDKDCDRCSAKGSKTNKQCKQCVEDERDRDDRRDCVLDLR